MSLIYRLRQKKIAFKSDQKVFLHFWRNFLKIYKAINPSKKIINNNKFKKMYPEKIEGLIL
jgi:hypothetical protein